VRRLHAPGQNQRAPPAELVVNIGRVGDGVFDFCHEQVTASSAQAVDGDLHRSLGHGEGRRNLAVGDRLGVSPQEPLEVSEERCVTGVTILSPQGLDHLLEDREGPASLVDLLRGRRVREFPCVAALSVLEVQEVHRRRRTARATFHGACLSLLIRDEVFQRGQQERTELAAARVGDPEGAFLQKLDEERLGEIAGVLSGVSQASEVGLERVPVGPAQRRQRLFGVRRRRVGGRAHDVPTRGFEAARTTDSRGREIVR